MSEETVDDRVINFAIFIEALFAFFIGKPLNGLRWLIQRYPAQSITLLLGIICSLLGWAIFAQHVDPQIFSIGFVLMLVAFAASIANLFPLPD